MEDVLHCTGRIIEVHYISGLDREGQVEAWSVLESGFSCIGANWLLLVEEVERRGGR